MVLVSLDSKNKEIIFGRAISPIKTSANNQTLSGSIRVPTNKNANATNLKEPITIFLSPDKSFTLDSAKKYQPTIVVREKQDKAIDKNPSPNFPKALKKADWVIIVASFAITCAGIEALYEPETRLIKTVDRQIIKVDINTPIIAVKPCSQGWFVWATAWEWGVDPMPASFENSPLESQTL